METKKKADSDTFFQSETGWQDFQAESFTWRMRKKCWCLRSQLHWNVTPKWSTFFFSQMSEIWAASFPLAGSTSVDGRPSETAYLFGLAGYKKRGNKIVMLAGVNPTLVHFFCCQPSSNALCRFHSRLLGFFRHFKKKKKEKEKKRKETKSKTEDNLLK